MFFLFLQKNIFLNFQGLIAKQDTGKEGPARRYTIGKIFDLLIIFHKLWPTFQFQGWNWLATLWEPLSRPIGEGWKVKISKKIQTQKKFFCKNFYAYFEKFNHRFDNSAVNFGNPNGKAGLYPWGSGLATGGTAEPKAQNLQAIF